MRGLVYRRSGITDEFWTLCLQHVTAYGEREVLSLCIVAFFCGPHKLYGKGVIPVAP